MFYPMSDFTLVWPSGKAVVLYTTEARFDSLNEYIAGLGAGVPLIKLLPRLARAIKQKRVPCLALI
jgi:hypothetical protein